MVLGPAKIFLRWLRRRNGRSSSWGVFMGRAAGNISLLRKKIDEAIAQIGPSLVCFRREAMKSAIGSVLQVGLVSH